jgi:tetratricopeptide (TPR) repeat protein
MESSINSVIEKAGMSIRSGDWDTVSDCANEIIREDKNNPDGHFLMGLVAWSRKNPLEATKAFKKVLTLDPNRCDAGVELANQLAITRRHKEAVAVLQEYEGMLDESPMYLDMAGSVYTDIGLPRKAYPLFKKAAELEPRVAQFQSNLASSAAFVGNVDEARKIYRSLLQQFPKHKRNHYNLSQLGRVQDESHIQQMKDLLNSSSEPPQQNIYLYYAIGKELEDLERWEEAFEYYKKAGDAVTGVATYDMAGELMIIDRIIDICDQEWLTEDPDRIGEGGTANPPIFIVDQPIAGTTLMERIISSHPEVQSLGETMLFQMVLRRASHSQTPEVMTLDMVDILALMDMEEIAMGYEEAVAYRRGIEPMYIDKLPFNLMYLGFIAKAWPDAKIIHVVRNPMDSCFSMYKQVFTWAYKFSYSLDWLGQYYIAYDRLCRHWQSLLGDRLIEVKYEKLVGDPENQTRLIFDRLGLTFEGFSPVGEKVHSESVNQWTHFAEGLQPLKEHLEDAGIKV